MQGLRRSGVNPFNVPLHRSVRVPLFSRVAACVAILILIATSLCLLVVDAHGQEGIPDAIGNGLYPEGLKGVTDLEEVKKWRYRSLHECARVLEARIHRGIDGIGGLLNARIDLVVAQLDLTTEPQQRLDCVQEGLAAALSWWRSAMARQRDGFGNSDAEAQARAAVFRFRVMWLKERAMQDAVQEGLPQDTISGSGIPSDVGAGEYPPGLVGVTDIDEVTKSRIQALKDSVQALEDRYLSGRDSIRLLLQAQSELAVAQLDSTHVGQERLDHLQQCLTQAVRIWRQASARHVIGLESRDSEAQSRAAVFRFRVMWLKERAMQDAAQEGMLQDTISGSGIPSDVGAGEYPPGLVGVTDIDEVTKSRIQALKDSVQALEGRFLGGRDSIRGLLDAKLELTLAQLDSTDFGQERLDIIEQGLAAAIMTWQGAHAKFTLGIGGKDEEAQATSLVFTFRQMWLEEKAMQDAATAGQK